MHEISRVVLSDVLSDVFITNYYWILPEPMNAIKFMHEISRVVLSYVLWDVFITIYHWELPESINVI
jgi:hypothetical protein